MILPDEKFQNSPEMEEIANLRDELEAREAMYIRPLRRKLKVLLDRSRRKYGDIFPYAGKRLNVCMREHLEKRGDWQDGEDLKADLEAGGAALGRDDFEKEWKKSISQTTAVIRRGNLIGLPEWKNRR